MQVVKKIQAKGYDFEESKALAHKVFENADGQHVERFIDMLLSKEEYLEEYGLEA